MKWYWSVPLLLALLMLCAGCRRSEEVEAIAVSTFVADFRPAQLVTLAELAADPAAYLDQPIQITGQFGRLPKLVCLDSMPRLSPASWTLVADGWVAQAGGPAEDIADLVPEGLTMTVEGTWRRWQGLVGCGKRAEMVDTWYLEVDEVLSPRPLVRVTVTPGVLEGTQVAQIPSATPSENASGETLTPAPPQLSATPTPIPLASPIPRATTGPSATPGAPAGTVLPDPGRGGTDTPSPEATQEDEAATPDGTVSVTPEGTPPVTPDGTSSVTPTPAVSGTPGTETPTATVSATPSGPVVVDMGSVGFHSLVLDTLDPRTRHGYTITVEAGTAITVGLVMPADFDPVIKLLDAEGKVLVDRNSVGAGEVERLENQLLEDDGEYRIVVHDIQDRATDYTFTADDGLSLDYLFFAGLLEYGDTDNTFMPDDRIDFWHFYGEAGDEVTVTLTPNDSSDLRFRLRNPLLEWLTDAYVDDRSGGQPEQATFVLPSTGIYTIQVEEYNLQSSDYVIRLTEAQ